MAIQQLAYIGIAFTAIPADPEAFDQLLAGASALIDGFADLTVGYRFADADIHVKSSWVGAVRKLTAPY